MVNLHLVDKIYSKPPKEYRLLVFFHAVIKTDQGPFRLLALLKRSAQFTRDCY